MPPEPLIRQAGRMNAGAFAEGLHLGSLGATVGLVVLDPTAYLRRAPDWSGWVAGHQRLDRVMSRLAPPLFLTTAAGAALAAAVAATERRPRRAAARALTAALVGASIAVTLRGNEPVNVQIRDWRPTDPPASGWSDTRDRWERAHRGRRALLALAATVSVAA